MIEKIKLFLCWPISRKIEYIYIRLKMTQMNFISRYRYISVGKGCFIIKPIILTPEFISLGDKVSFRHHARIEAISSFSSESFTPNIIIESGVTFQQRCHITAASRLVIGKGTIASFDVMITDIDHEYEDVSLPISQQKLAIKPTYIGESCFLGGGVKIQAGTTLGRHCIVGSNSVVRGQFPDYCVIVGAPARIVKRYNENTSQWEKTDNKGGFIS